MKHIKGDFQAKHFAGSGFGFTGSAKGAPAPARPHLPAKIPTPQAAKAAANAFHMGAQAGQQQGAQKALQGAAAIGQRIRAAQQAKASPMGALGRAGMAPPAAAGAPPMPTPPAAPPPPMPGGSPLGMKKGGFVKGAIKHPGRETRRAKEHRVSVHEQMVHDSHSSDPSLRGAGALGLRLTKGDLHRGKKKG